MALKSIRSHSSSAWAMGTRYSSWNHFERSCMRHRSVQNGREGVEIESSLLQTGHLSNLPLMAVGIPATRTILKYEKIRDA